ncbi:uncharacterized protein LOC115750983 [Rhodamnia argentea]|uniref:Uncharacterized protein LOC115750983 n=1 Tax=Rhodamnia argentea TaxID=178133 RepID=A0A8B8QD72_9MYRT|nr:uncharacterized protein LOC115750983 [Rhodamnia argentea]
MAGGKRRSNSRKNKSSSSNSKSNSRDDRRRGRGGFNASASIRAGLFVEGGALSDWQLKTPSPPPRRGSNQNLDTSKAGSSGRGKGTGSKSLSRSLKSNAVGYQYPALDLQDGLHPLSTFRDTNVDSKIDFSQPFILCGSKENQVIAYVDEGPSSMDQANVSYEYHSDFVLGDSSHRGLGYDNENNAAPSGIEASSGKMENQEELESGMSSPEQEEDYCESFDTGTAEKRAQLLSKKRSAKKNSGFISIGGIKLYTEDISDEEDGEDDVVECSDEEDSESESAEQDGATDSSESDDSEDMSDSGSDVDDDIAQDYLEGIGGSDALFDSKYLLKQVPCSSDDSDDSSSSDLDETLEKLGGIALQDASTEYGMQRKRQSNHQGHRTVRDNQSSAVDDFILVKDVRTLSAKKNRGTRVPQSRSLESQKSTRSRRFPGEKKKHRKELVAAKRRDRMIRRGVDLVGINKKLEQIVLNGVDIHSFQPMHSRDCSKVQRLARIYRLRSSSQGSGKKRFVTVVQTPQTCMPSSTDKLILEKLIGPVDEDADFSVIDGPHVKTTSGGQKQVRPQEAKKSGRSKSLKNSVNRSGGKVSLASQPVSFVSSGVMPSEMTEVSPINLAGASENGQEHATLVTSGSFGAFEVHTRGFGSKMMAKMGFIEGQGLGKGGAGMAEPIEVIKRPKSLGLGMSFPESAEESERNRESESQSAKSKQSGIGGSVRRMPQSVGAFERHTKGFGSRMMAKMGFVEGMGLGKNSQGIVNPLAAVRLPKSRGLGATG